MKDYAGSLSVPFGLILGILYTTSWKITPQEVEDIVFIVLAWGLTCLNIYLNDR